MNLLERFTTYWNSVFNKSPTEFRSFVDDQVILVLSCSEQEADQIRQAISVAEQKASKAGTRSAAQLLGVNIDNL